MPSPRATLALVRWPNAVLSAAGVLVGAWWAGGRVSALAVLLTALAAVALTAVANAENDYQDRVLDSRAHPERPIPRGTVRPRDARAVVAVSAVAAILLTLSVDRALAGITVLVIVVMLIYTPLLKPLGAPGNIAVAVVASLPFVYGAWAVGDPGHGWALLAVAAPLHFARELAKDIEDGPADAATRRTIPVAYGPRTTRLVLIASVAIFVAAVAFLAREHPRLGALAAPALIVVAVATARVVRGDRGGPSLYKLAMACAMVSLVLAR